MLFSYWFCGVCEPDKHGLFWHVRSPGLWLILLKLHQPFQAGACSDRGGSYGVKIASGGGGECLEGITQVDDSHGDQIFWGWIPVVQATATRLRELKAAV